LDRRLGESQTLSGRCGEENILDPTADIDEMVILNWIVTCEGVDWVYTGMVQSRST
jgi:hypothetical protein